MTGATRGDHDNVFQIPIPWWAAVASVPTFASVFQTGTVFEVSGSVVTDAIIGDKYTMQWPSGAAILFLLIGVALTPWLRTQIGKRQIYVLGLVFFAIGSLVEAGSNGLTVMTLGRAISGLGKGFVLANLRAMLFATLKDSLPHAIAFYGMVGYSSRAVSPVLAAYTVDYLSWRWVYLFQTMLALSGLGLTFRFMPDDRPKVRSSDSLDIFGLLLWILSITGIMVVFDRGQRWGYWTSDAFVLCVAITLVLLVAFLYWELHAPNPLMNLRYLLSIRTYVLAQISKSVFLCVLYSVLSLIADYMLTLRGYPRTTSGFVLLPMAAGLLLSMFGVAYLATARSERTRELTEQSRQVRLIVGMGLSTLTVWHLAQIDLYTSKFWIAGMLFLVGLALGLTVLPVLAYAQYGLDPKYAPYAASIGLTVLILPITLVDASTTIAKTRWADTYTDSLCLALEDGRAVVQNVTDHVALELAQKGSHGPELSNQVHSVLAHWLADNAGFCAYQTVLRYIALLPLFGILFALLIEPSSLWSRISFLFRHGDWQGTLGQPKT